MEETELHILIVADATPRATIIRHLLEEKFPGAELDIARTKDLSEDYSRKNSLVCILDLMSSAEPSLEAIKRIKNKLPRARIIGMHIYRSSALITPLYEYGIHGYVFCEPTRQELSLAVDIVLKGEIFYPDFFSHT